MNTENSSPPMMEKIADYWSWRSEVYHTACSRHPQWHEIFLSPFEGKQSLRLLDMGTGTGFLALGFAERGHRVTGVDLSPEMIAFAKKEALRHNLAVEFLEGNAQEPPFQEEKIFDGITCRNLLWTLPNPLQALRAWKKLLKPEGTVVLADGMWEPRLYLAKNEPVTKVFTNAYEEIRKELPYFTGLQASQGEGLLLEAGFTSVVRHDALFRENPYEYRNEFFVLSAKKCSR